MQSSSWQNTLFLNFQIVPEVPRIYFINNCQRQFLVKQRNKVENLKLVQIKYYFGTKLDFSKIQNKIWGVSFLYYEPP